MAVGDNPDRLRSESAFAHLCGVAPVPASPGKTSRYRLNRDGDRQANYALYILAVTHMAWGPEPRADAAKRRSEAKTNKEVRMENEFLKGRRGAFRGSAQRFRPT